MALAIGGMHLISGTTSCASEIPNQTQQDQSQAAGMSVTVAPVETTRTHNTTGTVAAREPHCRLPQTTGLQIKQILVEAGDVVKTGQVMAVLDNSVLQT